MRPAPPREGTPDGTDDPGDPAAKLASPFPADQTGRSGRLRLIGVAIAALVVVAALAIAFAVTRHGPGPVAGGPSPSPSTPASPTPPRVRFAFADVTSIPLSSGGSAPSADASQVARDIAASLSTFYDAAFVDPAAWGKPVPAATWAPFATDVRAQAQKDAETLTLGSAGARLRSLSVTGSSIQVRVLFDPSGHASTAVAAVTFQAQAVMKDGQTVQVTSEGSFLLQPERGTWEITGYPSVQTTVEPAASSAPSSAPAPTGSPRP